jgi:hypothetical protein
MYVYIRAMIQVLTWVGEPNDGIIYFKKPVSNTICLLAIVECCLLVTWAYMYIHDVQASHWCLKADTTLLYIPFS